MPKVPFDSLPDDARLWIFPADRPLTGSDAERLLTRVDAFLADWKAHGQPLTAGRDWRDDRFLLVAVDERSAPPSGCSIDALLGVLKALEPELGMTITDHGHVQYRDDGGEVAYATRGDFARLAEEGTVSADTRVFDATLTRLGPLREGRFEVPARESWHRRAFFRGLATLALAFITGLGAWACGEAAGPAPEEAGFVTTLGQDTMAVERFRIQPGRVEADVLLRSPRVTLGHYVLETDDQGRLQRYRAEIRPPDAPQGPPLRSETIVADQGGYTRTVSSDDGETSEAWEGDPTALPFIDLAHWPFEVALRRAVDSPGDTLVQPFFTGSRGMSYRLVRRGGGEWGLRHPTRGTSAARVDAQGRLLSLDGYGTTRALILERTEWLDLDPLAAGFAGRPTGELSGRGEVEATVDDATLTVDYGRPQKRGREIFGKLVEYGSVWRTGANMATHFSTDRDLELAGSLRVPAGEYTLFSIPGEDRGILIVNRQTGQTGTAYQEELDLGRVPMRRDTLDDPVETFTIGVRDTDDGGVLELLWDRTAYRVAFEVR